jgi:multidrug efflux pump subunit AcrB
VSPAELSNIQEGQVITLFAGASGERAKAKVIFVSPLLDKDTRTARVVALLPNPTHQWRPGSFVPAEFHSRRSRPASSSPSSPSSGATPVRIKDVADVAGRELRTGSASVNGHEAVLGTALMPVGSNSRTVAAAADAKIKEINKSLPPGIRARTLLNRTQLSMRRSR